MPTLTMTKGLPASGKTTWAKQQNAKRVNKDDLRAMIDNGVWSKENEKLILEARDLLVDNYLRHECDVIVDDTGFSPEHEKKLSAIAEMNGAGFKIKDFTDVPLSVCLKRDSERANAVGEKVIKSMYNSFLKGKVNVVKREVRPHDPDLPTCIIVDIDGTLAHMNGRSPYDYSKVHTDIVDATVRDIVRKYNDGDSFIKNIYTVILSGREDSCKAETIQWLRDNDVPFDEIYMRSTGDMRNDAIVKEEIYNAKIKNRYNVLFVLDDRDRVVNKWRELGLKCLQVEPGDF